MSDLSGGAGWWQASDGKWYRPEQHPDYKPPPPPPSILPSPAAGQGRPLFVGTTVTTQMTAASIPPPVSWQILESSGSLSLARSSEGFAVFDRQTTFGRWSNTDEGYHFAKQTFDAHRQSFAHGVAYTATGYRDPVGMGLPTEPIVKSKTYASPLSYVGSTRRLIAFASKAAKRSPMFGILAWVMAIVGMLFMWTFLIFWYFVVFFLFGVFTFPYRLIRRSQRKNLHIQQTSLATQQAILQQQRAMMTSGYPQPAMPSYTPQPLSPPMGQSVLPPGPR